MKQWLLYFVGFVVVSLLVVFAFEAGRSYQYRIDEAIYISDVIEVKSELLLIERIMDIQREIGCKMIDGEIGDETKRKVNAITLPQEKILFNRYASKYMTPSGRPKNE